MEIRKSIGALAEYFGLPKSYFKAIKPIHMSFEEASKIPRDGMDGLHFLRKGKVKLGEKILINLAGNIIGSYAEQIL